VGVGKKEALALVLLLALLLTLLVRQANATGVTMDEPNHILGSHFFWNSPNTYRVSDLAPLLKIVTGWVPADLPPATHPRWQTRDEWAAAAAWSVDQPNPYYQDLLVRFRLPALLFSLATALLLWLWARSFAGPVAAILAAAVFAFEPTALAHGALVKNDVAAALGYLAFWFAAWRYWRTPNWRSVAWLAAAALLGVLAKLSLIILAGLGPIVLLSRRWRRFPLYFLLFITVLYLGLCTAYQWHVRVLHPVEVIHKWADPKIPWLFTAVGQVFQWLPVPSYFWEGCVSLLWSSADRPPIYLLGTIRHIPDPFYFLIALAVKVPFGFLVLFLAAAAFTLRKRDSLSLFLLFPPVLYIALASLSGHQLGVRLILPALPFAALMAARMAQQWRRFALIAAACGAIESLAYYPHGIAFFNVAAGGPANGLRYLADSNLDWGQDLPGLRRWFNDNNGQGLRLAYFGADTPWRFFNDKEIVFTPPPWSPELAKGQIVLQPEPALYAISATLLPGHFFKTPYEDYYKNFRQLKPTARIGYSIYIYDLRQPGIKASANPKAPDPQGQTAAPPAPSR
jgi:4-amino-4-deoxy-L-arabinose transferase-like glycosyltransferase